MSHIDTLRERLVELRVDERELVEQLDAIQAKLTANRDEQTRTKHLLVTDAKTSLRLQSVTSKESARGTIARLGGFTMSEAIAELGWERPRVKKLLDAMMCEKPPTVVQDGKVGTRPFFRYAGPPIEQADPVAERERAALEAIREWVIGQSTTFTPAECAAACDTTRVTALRALRSLQELGAVVDEGPTQDMPIFRVWTDEIPDVAINPPALTVVEAEPLSKIPQINELLVAAQNAGCEIVPANGHFAIEALDGTRVIIDAKPKGRTRLLADKAKLRKLGVPV